MQRLFVANAIENNTCVHCRVSLDGRQEKNGTKKVYSEKLKFKACSKKREFSELYDYLKKKYKVEADRLAIRNETLYIFITVQGDVNGFYQEQHFDELNEFREWLENHRLVDKLVIKPGL